MRQSRGCSGTAYKMAPRPPRPHRLYQLERPRAETRRETGEDNSQEEHVEHHDELKNGQSHPVDGVECHGVLSLEEVRRRGERTREGSDVLEALALVAA